MARITGPPCPFKSRGHNSPAPADEDRVNEFFERRYWISERKPLFRGLVYRHAGRITHQHLLPLATHSS
jgi:hypothetical protein